jgi:hypothetical protein
MAAMDVLSLQLISVCLCQSVVKGFDFSIPRFWQFRRFWQFAPLPPPPTIPDWRRLQRRSLQFIPDWRRVHPHAPHLAWVSKGFLRVLRASVVDVRFFALANCQLPVADFQISFPANVLRRCQSIRRSYPGINKEGVHLDSGESGRRLCLKFTNLSNCQIYFDPR